MRSTLRDDLCGSASDGSNVGPAVCATAVRKAFPQWHPASTVHLCRGAESADAATCAAGFSRQKGGARIDPDVIVSLCRPFGSQGGLVEEEEKQRILEGPSSCVASAPRGWSTAQVIELCQDALASLDGKNALPAPAQCAADAAKPTRSKRSSSSTPAAASAINFLLKQPEVVSKLCQRAGGARGEGPLECVASLPADLLKKAASSSASGAAALEKVVEVCGKAADDLPARCFALTSSAELCRGTRSLAPAECLVSPSLSSLDPNLRFALCSSLAEEDAIDEEDVDEGADDGVSGRRFGVSPQSRDRETGRGGGKGYGGVAACVKAAPQELQQQLQQQQQRGGRRPSSHSSSSSSSSLLVELCRGASSAAPSHCVARAPASLSLAEKVRLCAGAQSQGSSGGASGPPACFKAIRTLRVSSQDPADRSEALRLCQGASGDGPAACLEASPRDLPIASRVNLCTRAVSTAPAECAQRAHHKLPQAWRGVEVELCKGLTSLQPPPPTAAEAAAAAAAAASSRRVKKKQQMPQPSIPVAVTFGGPSDCAVEASRLLPTSSTRTSSSRGGGGGGGGLDAEGVVVLCRGADVRAAWCAANTNSSSSSPSGGMGAGKASELSVRDRCLVCSQARSSLPLQCAANSPGVRALFAPPSSSSSSSSSSTTTVISSSSRTSTTSNSGGERLARLCGGANSVAPGRCATFELQKRMKHNLDDAELEKCRTAVSVPKSLRVLRMWWEGAPPPPPPSTTSGGGSSKRGGTGPSPPASSSSSSSSSSTAGGDWLEEAIADERGSGLFAGRRVHVVLGLLDQFGLPLGAHECPGCPPAPAAVSASAKGVDGALGDLEGIRSNISSPLAGIVEFHNLVFSASGDYDLKFTLSAAATPTTSTTTSSARVGSSGPLMMRVKVEAHEDDALGPLGRCGQLLYPLLHSPVGGGGGGWGSSGGGGGGGGGGGLTGRLLHGGEEVAFVPAPFVGALLPLLSPEYFSQALNQNQGLNASSLASRDTEAKEEGNDDDASGRGGGDCADVLTSVGIRTLPGWGGDVWVVYRPVVLALDLLGGILLSNPATLSGGEGGAGAGAGSPSGRGAGVPQLPGFETPHASMTDLQRLGLDVLVVDNGDPAQRAHRTATTTTTTTRAAAAARANPAVGSGARGEEAAAAEESLPSLRDLKRAYYRHSLLWHPDRWVGYPTPFRRRAMDCFELISAAYKRLLEAVENRRKKEEGNPGEGPRRSPHLEEVAPPSVIEL